jgi:microcystin-dependent protein
MATFTPNKNLSKPANGAPAWDTPINSDWDAVDLALGGIQRFNLAGASGGITLTNALAHVPPAAGDNSHIPAIFSCTGAMAGDVVLVLLSGFSGHWIISNFTSPTHDLYIMTNGAGANNFKLPNGITSHVYSEGVYVYPVGSTATVQQLALIGEVKMIATPFIPATWLLCAGQAVSRTTYSQLFAYIGGYYGTGDGSSTFNVPDLRGRVPSGADNMGGAAANRLPGWSLGVNGGSWQAQLTDVGQLPWHNHGGGNHAHGASQDAHAHTVGGSAVTGSGGSLGISVPAWAIGPVITDTRQPNVYVGASGDTIGAQGGSNPFFIVQPTQALNYIIYAGV